ncbi:MAG: L-threonylcarbamoyladenylate synthase [Ignavibacteriaceae bacterium]
MAMSKNNDLISIDENIDFAVQRAKKLFLEGSVFVYPTDTVYGFGANPFNEEAITRIDLIKHRENDRPYIMLVNSIETLLKYIEIKSEKHLDFLLAIWPNPVSVVLSLNSKTNEILGVKTAAFRIPNHRFCLKLTSELEMPLISTSVNRSGQPPIIESSVIYEEFSSEIEAIFHTGKKSFYSASTLIDLSDSVPVLLRSGKIKFEDLLDKFQKC